MARTARTERADTTREAEALTEDNWLSIPDAVVDRYLDEGYALKWVRISIKGQEDYKNLGLKMRDGYTFVSPEEVPEMAAGFQVGDVGKLGKLVLRGDVALAKAPAEKINARKTRVRQRTNQLTEAINEQLMANSDRRLPITNNSRSRVATGKQARFDD